jgi:hypothetical protein
MNRALARTAYLLILRAHPSGFEERFGDEMLWIFDEECKRGAAGKVLCDGVASLLRQRCRVERTPAASTILGVAIQEDGIGVAQFLQAGILAFLLVGGALAMLGERSPVFSIRWPAWSSRGSLVLHARPHVEVVPARSRKFEKK